MSLPEIRTSADPLTRRGRILITAAALLAMLALAFVWQLAFAGQASADTATGCTMIHTTWGWAAHVTYVPNWWEFWRSPYSLDWYGYWCA